MIYIQNVLCKLCIISPERFYNCERGIIENCFTNYFYTFHENILENILEKKKTLCHFELDVILNIEIKFSFLK